MLINSLRFYERILLGLHAPDVEVQEYAAACLSYLIVHIKFKQQVLPSAVAAMLDKLPEGA